MEHHVRGHGQPTPPAPNHPPPPAPAPPSPPGHGSQGAAGPGSAGASGGKGGKVRGVPPSFGYVKRPTSGGSKGEARTAQVSAVPRTKLKVSGGTQTCTSDYKSYSLTGPAASQLSQSVRDRLMQGSHSLPRNATSSVSMASIEYAGLTGPNQGQVPGHATHRPFRPSDGSLSDSNYSDLQAYYSSPWLRHSAHATGSAAYTASLPTRSNKYDGE